MAVRNESSYGLQVQAYQERWGKIMILPIWSDCVEDKYLLILPQYTIKFSNRKNHPHLSRLLCGVAGAIGLKVLMGRLNNLLLSTSKKRFR